MVSNPCQEAAATPVEAFMRSALEGSKEEVPGDVDGAMDQGGREDRAGLAPGPAVEGAGDTSESKKAGEDKKTPMVAPADGIAGSVDAADQHKCCERDVHAHHHRENIREAAAGKGPKPVRQRPSPGIRQRFYREPYSSDG